MQRQIASTIYAEEILCKDIFCEGGAQSVHAFGRQISLTFRCGVGDQMHMGMMAFVVERGKPFQILDGDIQICGQRFGL